MKAATFDRTSARLIVSNVDDPQPGPGQLVLRVHRCGVCGSDLHMTDAHSPFQPAQGAVIGHEFAGEIVACGPGVGTWKEGQRVTALPFMGCGDCAQCRAGEPIWCARARSHTNGSVGGGYAEYVLVGANETVALPDVLDYDHGALVEPLAVGLHALRLAAPRPGARMLVLGAGPVGLAVAACARTLTGGPVFVAARSDRRAELARRLGATDFLSADHTLGDAFAKAAGGPPDVVFECVGMPGAIERAGQLAGPRGTVLVLGACMMEDRLQPIVPTIKELRLQFALGYDKREFEVATQLLATERIDLGAMVTGVVGFDEFSATFETLRGSTSHCKVLLDPSRA
jgi:threonine dehydrogenase-like Zn-dependent dehydrogenase